MLHRLLPLRCCCLLLLPLAAAAALLLLLTVDSVLRLRVYTRHKQLCLVSHTHTFSQKAFKKVTKHKNITEFRTFRYA